MGDVMVLLSYDSFSDRLREIEDEEIKMLTKVATTILLVEGDFLNRPEPIDMVAFIDAMEILFAKRHIIEAAAEHRLHELKWWPDDDM